MNYNKNMEGCQMSLEQKVNFEDAKNGLYAKAFMIRTFIY